MQKVDLITSPRTEYEVSIDIACVRELRKKLGSESSPLTAVVNGLCPVLDYI